jgi:hypothetical protein
MERKIITINDFYDVARNNDYFLWHFLQKNQEKGVLGIHSYFRTNERLNKNSLKEIIDLVDIPYFESYVEDSIDFLHDVGGFEFNQLWNYENIPNSTDFKDVRYNPVLIGFKKFSKVSDTLGKCYCVDGVLEVIADLNPEFLSKINTED